MYVFFDGKIINDEKINISSMSESILYGYGLFETIKVCRGKMYFFDEHINRMKAGCKLIDLDFMLDIKNIKMSCEEIIKANELKFGAIRISYLKNNESYYILITVRNNIYTEDIYDKGFKLCFSNIKRNPYSPIVKVKSNNYIENILARKKAHDRGYNEALFLNVYDKICEGTVSNIFFIKDKEIYTPSLKCGILEGIVRDKVIEIVQNLNIKINFGEYEKDMLYEADEIFLTNSLMDIMPVSEIEGRKINLKNNKITRLLMKELQNLYR
ncbi:4-amino-4-deoxychorismate lyase [Caminicella sporogenes DSM 14501]|uniref:4-amino-4-deoxychorismate lyase n=1 Tax=Caminicella sporogenes DSM 14501 TaxID=1121266 RepID=A0A1M6P1I9_9FIRM|nr:aminotransferase class IV [Caminicella sporogenes]SHK01801.1 4-amino-4-deoxychorismate lyase [Caminicella sporogenes DSM 14501]